MKQHRVASTVGHIPKSPVAWSRLQRKKRESAVNRARLAQLIEQGLSPTEAARSTGLTITTVRAHYIALGYEDRYARWLRLIKENSQLDHLALTQLVGAKTPERLLKFCFQQGITVKRARIDHISTSASKPKSIRHEAAALRDPSGLRAVK